MQQNLPFMDKKRDSRWSPLSTNADNLKQIRLRYNLVPYLCRVKALEKQFFQLFLLARKFFVER